MKVKIKFKERIFKCYNLSTDLLNNPEDYEADKEVEKTLNEINNILIDIINKYC